MGSICTGHTNGRLIVKLKQTSTHLDLAVLMYHHVKPFDAAGQQLSSVARTEGQVLCKLTDKRYSLATHTQSKQAQNVENQKIRFDKACRAAYQTRFTMLRLVKHATR